MDHGTWNHRRRRGVHPGCGPKLGEACAVNTRSSPRLASHIANCGCPRAGEWRCSVRLCRQLMQGTTGDSSARRASGRPGSQVNLPHGNPQVTCCRGRLLCKREASCICHAHRHYGETSLAAKRARGSWRTAQGGTAQLPAWPEIFPHNKDDRGRRRTGAGGNGGEIGRAHV